MTINTTVLELLFTGANLFVLPFWALMVLVPNTNLTRTVMMPLWPITALAGLYLFLFLTSFSNVEGLEAFSDPNLSLVNLSALFANPHVTATGWMHYLAFDLFVGRWIYWQGQIHGVFIRHSLALTLFAGPIGLLSHLVTDAVWKRFSQKPTAIDGEGVME
jgi:hypothetical protein